MSFCCNNPIDIVHMLLLLLFGIIVTQQFQSKAAVLPGPSCPKKCGDVDIVFPFGIGADCAMEGFKLDCNKTKDGRSNVTYWYDMPVMNISLLHGEVRMKNYISYMCSNHSTGSTIDVSTYYLELSDSPFTFSEHLNVFTVVGINTLAYMVGHINVLGCLAQSWPANNRSARDGVCDGAGCCQVALTHNMSYYKVEFAERYNATAYINSTYGAEYCGYAAMMEAAAFHFRTAYLNTRDFWEENDGRVPVILDWVVGNETCDVASKKADSYACRSNNSRCIDSSNGVGYLCNCTDGYSGNPYLIDGCQDIDECVVNVPPPCPGHCTNIPGNYSCPNDKPPSSSGAVVLAVGLSTGVVIVVIAITCTHLLLERKKLANIKQKYFHEHGGMLLLQEISLKQGTGFSVFTEAELSEATHKFDDKNILGRGGHALCTKARSRTAV
ncbi:hypothetical protein BS78_10G058200 [Paspalum vaginatum]|nr:hypothetical protein BS78_10G058200 [Paspalum vaginatum]